MNGSFSFEHGDHVCGIYRTDEDHRELVLRFVTDGVDRGERMLYLVDLQTAAGLRDMLEGAGVDVEALTSSGQLVILTAKETYLRDSQFDPDKMIDLLDSETEAAVALGYSGLRVTAEMTWALGGEPGSERLIEYESKVNRLFTGRKATAVCQYDRRRFDAEVLLDVLHTHPQVLVGTQRFANEAMYFVPPDGFLSGDRQSAMLDRWVQNLASRERRPA